MRPWALALIAFVSTAFIPAATAEVDTAFTYEITDIAEVTMRIDVTFTGPDAGDLRDAADENSDGTVSQEEAAVLNELLMMAEKEEPAASPTLFDGFGPTFSNPQTATFEQLIGSTAATGPAKIHLVSAVEYVNVRPNASHVFRQVVSEDYVGGWTLKVPNSFMIADYDGLTAPTLSVDKRQVSGAMDGTRDIEVTFVQDTDGDQQVDSMDNCPTVANQAQLDSNNDDEGNACDDDDDGDGATDVAEASRGTNPIVADSDKDGVNDPTDTFPRDPKETRDSDSDGTGDNADLAPKMALVSTAATLILPGAGLLVIVGLAIAVPIVLRHRGTRSAGLVAPTTTPLPAAAPPPSSRATAPATPTPRRLRCPKCANVFALAVGAKPACPACGFGK